MKSLSNDTPMVRRMVSRRSAQRLASGVCLLLAVVVSGCADTKTTSASEPPMAQDFCPEVLEILVDFDSSILKAMSGDDSETSDEVVENGHRLSLLVARAGYRGVDLSSLEADWMRNLGRSARLLVDLLEEPEKYTDEEKSDHLDTVVAWYKFAGSECKAVTA
jgi:hypothetical protein